MGRNNQHTELCKWFFVVLQYYSKGNFGVKLGALGINPANIRKDIRRCREEVNNMADTTTDRDMNTEADESQQRRSRLDEDDSTF